MPGESDSLIAMLDVATTALDGPMILTPRRFADTRGSFSEVWNARTMASVGLDFEFTQDNQSISTVAGTIRGLHYQAPPYAQGKLVRCAAGALCDIAVDVRKGSATYGQWTGVDLTAENGAPILDSAGVFAWVRNTSGSDSLPLQMHGSLQPRGRWCGMLE